jgi:hypothetical protein
MLFQGQDLDRNMINWQVDREKERQTKFNVQKDWKMNDLFSGKGARERERKLSDCANSESLSIHRMSLKSIFFLSPLENWHSRSHLLYWSNHLKNDFYNKPVFIDVIYHNMLFILTIWRWNKERDREKKRAKCSDEGYCYPNTLCKIIILVMNDRHRSCFLSNNYRHGSIM